MGLFLVQQLYERPNISKVQRIGIDENNLRAGELGKLQHIDRIGRRRPLMQRRCAERLRNVSLKSTPGKKPEHFHTRSTY